MFGLSPQTDLLTAGINIMKKQPSCTLQPQRLRHHFYHHNALAYALCTYVEDVCHGLR